MTDQTNFPGPVFNPSAQPSPSGLSLAPGPPLMDPTRAHDPFLCGLHVPITKAFFEKAPANDSPSTLDASKKDQWKFAYLDRLLLVINGEETMVRRALQFIDENPHLAKEFNPYRIKFLHILQEITDSFSPPVAPVIPARGQQFSGNSPCSIDPRVFSPDPACVVDNPHVCSAEPSPTSNPVANPRPAPLRVGVIQTAPSLPSEWWEVELQQVEKVLWNY